MTVSDFLKAIQLKPRFLFGVALLGFLLLVMPTTWASAIGVEGFRESARPYVGLGTLAGFVFWLVSLVPMASSRVKSWRRRREVIEALTSLSDDEWRYLAYLVYFEERTFRGKMINSSIHALCAKGLLVQHSGTGDILHWPYSIPTFLWRHFTRKPDAIFALRGVSADDPSLKKMLENMRNSIEGRRRLFPDEGY